MYCNLTRSHVFPLTTQFSSQSRCIKLFHTSKASSLRVEHFAKPSLNPNRESYTDISSVSIGKIRNVYDLETPKRSLPGLCYKSAGISTEAKARSVSYGFRPSSVYGYHSGRTKRRFLSSYSQRVDGENGAIKGGKSLPWLASNKDKEAKRSDVWTSKPSRSTGEKYTKRFEKARPNSSGEGSAKRFVKTRPNSSWEESAKRLDRTRPNSSWEQSAKVLEKARPNSSWEKSANRVENSSPTSSWEESAELLKLQDVKKTHNDVEEVSYHEKDGHVEEEGELDVDDPRWDIIRNKFQGTLDVKAGSGRPELQKWNTREAWGKKTWKEATLSTLPTIVGEGVYGVGPVLAALSSGRREFYALYVQEGLDLSSNNRKKKDKRGFQAILRIAEKLGLSIKEASKHDLNMIVDSRPHQGLVLDASPLEMVKLSELDSVSSDEEKGSVWVALDEVTDPQNLGAIIRSAYFFGVSGVVLCAKNSAPLSGVVSKASAGSLELMELRYCKNMMQFLVSSAENGWRVIGGSVSSRAVPLNEVSPGIPTILVLGSEGTGLRPLVERSCTQLVKIPGNIPLDGAVTDMEATEVSPVSSGEEFLSFLAVESLNVSVAAGVLLHHLVGKQPQQ